MKSLLLAPAMAFALVSGAWSAEIETEAAVAAATLYPQGASVERRADFGAEAGRHTVLIVGMPARFRRESLRVTGEGAFRILSIDGISAMRSASFRTARSSPRTLSRRRSGNCPSSTR
jgi:hypothetical protein